MTQFNEVVPNENDLRHGYMLGCDGLLSQVEAAKLLRIGQSTLRKYAKAGLVRKLAGRPVQYCLRSLNEYQRRREV